LSAQKRYSVGLEGGPVMTFLWGNKEIRENYDPAAAFSGGITFLYQLLGKSHLKTGLFFDRRGGKEDYAITFDQTYSWRVYHHYNYLSVPLLTYISLGKKGRLFADTGLSFDFLLKMKTIAHSLDGYGTQKDDKTENSYRFNLGILIGLGWSYPLREHLALSMEIRNNLGLFNVDKKNPSKYINTTGFYFGLEFAIFGAGKKE
jgi:hypothetical protein